MTTSLTNKLLTGSQSLNCKRDEIFDVVKILLGLLKQRVRLGGIRAEYPCGETEYFWEIYNNDDNPGMGICVEIAFRKHNSEDCESLFFASSKKTTEPNLKVNDIAIAHEHLDELIKFVDERYSALLKPFWNEIKEV
jgi:hypothetical protein